MIHKNGIIVVAMTTMVFQYGLYRTVLNSFKNSIIFGRKQIGVTGLFPSKKRLKPKYRPYFNVNVAIAMTATLFLSIICNSKNIVLYKSHNSGFVTNNNLENFLSNHKFSRFQETVGTQLKHQSESWR